MNIDSVFAIIILAAVIATAGIWFTAMKEALSVIASESDGHGNPRSALGRFKKIDGSIETVYTSGRFNLLMKVPDVELVEDLREDLRENSEL